MKQTKNNQPKPPAQKTKQKGKKSLLSLDAASFGPLQVKGLKIGRTNGMVGLGTRALNPQVAMPRVTSRRRVDGNVVDVLTGTDLVGTVTTSADGQVAGDLLLTQLISPSKFVDTRQLQFSALYQRYRYSRIIFMYEPIANATQSGQLLGFCDFDVADLLPMNDPTNVQVGAAHQGQNITQIWEPSMFEMRQLPSFTDLFVEDDGLDPRLSQQGIFYLMAASALPATMPLGNIYVSYEVEFSIPNLTPASLLPTTASWLTVSWSPNYVSSGGYLYLQLQDILYHNSAVLTCEADGNNFSVSGLVTGESYSLSLAGTCETAAAGTAFTASVLEGTNWLVPGSSYQPIGDWTGQCAVSHQAYVTFFGNTSFVASGGTMTWSFALTDSGGALAQFVGAVSSFEMNVYREAFTSSSLARSRRRTTGLRKEIDSLQDEVRDLTRRLSLTASKPALTRPEPRVSGGSPLARSQFKGTSDTNRTYQSTTLEEAVPCRVGALALSRHSRN